MMIETHLRIIPLLIAYEESGDLIYFDEDSRYCRFAVIDGLGHGKNAHKASVLALNHMKENSFMDPSESIKEIHNLLKDTVGAAMSVCILDKNTGRLLYSGIGNITTRTIGTNRIGFIPRDGIVGSILPTPQTHESYLSSGDIIIMYSDGIREYFDLWETPGLQYESAKVITETIIEKYSKKDDDVSLFTLKVL